MFKLFPIQSLGLLAFCRRLESVIDSPQERLLSVYCVLVGVCSPIQFSIVDKTRSLEVKLDILRLCCAVAS